MLPPRFTGIWQIGSDIGLEGFQQINAIHFANSVFVELSSHAVIAFRYFFFIADNFSDNIPQTLYKYHDFHIDSISGLITYTIFVRPYLQGRTSLKLTNSYYQ